MHLLSGPSRPQILFVLEGGRSRAEEADLQRVVTTVRESGAEVILLHHGLGALALRALRQALRQRRPDLLVTTGALSTAHLSSAALWAGCPVLCYLWPGGRYNLPRLGRNGPLAPERAPAPLPRPARFVLGNPAARAELLLRLGEDFPPERVHLLPPLLTPLPLVATPRLREGLVLGITGDERPRAELPLPTTLPFAISWLHGVGRGERLLSPEALAAVDVVLVRDPTHDETTRLCAEALAAGKPVLCLDGAPLPMPMDGWGDDGARPFQVLTAEELPARLHALLQDDTAGAARRVAQGAVARRFAERVLHPDIALPAHLTLIQEALEERSPGGLLRRVAKQVAAQALRRTPLLLRRRLPRRVALAYHQVVQDLRGWDPYLVVSQTTLERQVRSLLKAGYRAVPMGELALDEANDEPLLAITFDDGYEDTLTAAAPVLHSLGAPFTVYLITDMLSGALRAPWYEVVAHAILVEGVRARTLPLLREEPTLARLLSEHTPGPALARLVVGTLKGLTAPRRAALVRALEQSGGEALFAAVPRYLPATALPRLRTSGAELGSHTRSHPLLPQLDDAALRAELFESRAALQALGEEAAGLAYPNGDSDARVRAAAKAAGYRYAVAVSMPSPEEEGPFNRGRRMISEQSSVGLRAPFDEAIFLAKATGRW